MEKKRGRFTVHVGPLSGMTTELLVIETSEDPDLIDCVRFFAFSKTD